MNNFERCLMILEGNTNLYKYVGNCVNSFDEETGECIFYEFDDVSDFAVQEENAIEISKNNFLEMTLNGERYIKPKNEYKFLITENKRVVMAYNLDEDIHYFFIQSK